MELKLINNNVVLPSIVATTFRIALPNYTSSNFSRPLPNPHDSLIVLQCLCKLSFVARSRNELAYINFVVIEYHKAIFLSATFNGDVLFELSPYHGFTSGTKGLEGIDKRYDGHT
jgi:hypothetical protein